MANEQITKEIRQRREKVLREIQEIWPTQKRKTQTKDYGKHKCVECGKPFHKKRITVVCCSTECQYKRTKRKQEKYYTKIGDRK